MNLSKALGKLHLQAEKILRTNADILVYGAAGTGKTYWAKNLAGRISGSYKIFEGRGFSYEDLNIGNSDCVIIEDVEQLAFSEQSKILMWLEHPNRKTRAVFTSRANLWEMVQKQNFRSDLYFRISVAALRLPEIQEMKEDLPSLAQHLIGVYEILHNRPRILLSESAINKLLEWNWPGNFSELENVLEKAVLLTHKSVLSDDDIETNERATVTSSVPIKKLAEVERDLILQTLKLTQQNRTRAAEILGISIRTLRNKIQEYREEGIL
jgi:two-component system, NtrC family, response regulator AtoC